MLADKLKELRKGKKLSQEDLAGKLNVVRQTVSKWEKGFSTPDTEMLLRIAQVLEVQLNVLLREIMENGGDREMANYDVIIIGAGPGGIFAAYELMQHKPQMKVAVFEAGHALQKRRCPIDGEKVKSCIGCKNCSIMSGFGGAGAFSDGKYNITNDFGGTLYEYIGKKQALDLMRYVDDINMRYGGEGTKLYTTAGTRFKTLCIQNDLHLLDASVRHLGTDINYVVLENLYAYLQDKVDFFFDTPVQTVAHTDNNYEVYCQDGVYHCEKCIISVGRSGSKWMETVCRELDIAVTDDIQTLIPVPRLCQRCPRGKRHCGYLILLLYRNLLFTIKKGTA